VLNLNCFYFSTPFSTDTNQPTHAFQTNCLPLVLTGMLLNFSSLAFSQQNKSLAPLQAVRIESVDFNKDRRELVAEFGFLEAD